MDGPSRNLAIRQQAATFVDDTFTWVDGNNRNLSQRLWTNRQVVRNQIAATLRESLATGRTTAQTTRALRGYIDPSYGGNAYSGAERLAVTETSRANALATRQTANATPGVRWLRYELTGGHPREDACDQNASRDEGHGRGVYPIDDSPMPPVHPRCRCVVSMVFDQSDMIDLAQRLRVEYGLDQEPTNLSPDDLTEWRRQTKALKEQVVFLFRGWTQQTGLVDMDDLKPSTRSVKDWVAAVLRRKRGG